MNRYSSTKIAKVVALFSSIVDNIDFNVPLYLFEKQKANQPKQRE